MNRDMNLNNKATIKDITTTDKMFFKMILPSVLGIFLCVICLATLTWSWFSEETQMNTTLIEAANYSATVSIYETNDANKTAVAYNQLMKDVEYTVEIKTNATENTVGFCEIKINDLIFVAEEEGVTFTLTPDVDNTSLKVDALWGSVFAVYPDKPVLENNKSYRLTGGTLEEKSAEETTKEESASTEKAGE